MDIPKEWRIHPVFSIAQLEPCPPPDSDPFARPRPYNPDSVYVEGDTDLVKSFEVERLISKRQTKRRGPEYLVRWKGYGPEHDAWRNIPELGDAAQHLKDYKDGMKTVATLDGRHPRVNIPKAVPKHIVKKQNIEQTLRKRAAKKPDTRRAAAVATPTHKPTSLTPTSKDTTGLRRSERLKNKEQISYSEEVGDH